MHILKHLLSIVCSMALAPVFAADVDWPTYGLDYSNQRYSSIEQINASNVSKLAKAWSYKSGVKATFQATPIMVDKTLYLSLPFNHVVALDAVTGNELWRYNHPRKKDYPLCCGTANRGVAVANGKVYVGTVDARLIALDAKSGKVLWDIQVADGSSAKSESVTSLKDSDPLSKANIAGTSGVGIIMAPVVYQGMADQNHFASLSFRKWEGLPKGRLEVEDLVIRSLSGSYLTFGRDDGVEVLCTQILSLEPLTIECISTHFSDYLDEMPDEQRLIAQGNWVFRIQIAYELLSETFTGELTQASIASSVQTCCESIILDLHTLEGNVLLNSGCVPGYAHLDWTDQDGHPDWFNYIPMETQDQLSLVSIAIATSDFLQDRVAQFYAANPHRFPEICKQYAWRVDYSHQNILVKKLLESCRAEEVLPPWCVFHIPHSSTGIPKCCRDQFILSDQELSMEALRFADLYTDDLFDSGSSCPRIVFDQSRLLVDVERFSEDYREVMNEQGLGAVYSVTSALNPLRRGLDESELQNLINWFYKPHHQELESWVTTCLGLFGKCLIIDCHSFPDAPFAYENQSLQKRPDICLGTDPLHTSQDLIKVVEAEFVKLGYSVAIDYPFAGTIVPIRYLGVDQRVQSIMIEVNKKLYLGDDQYSKSDQFEEVNMDMQRVLVALATQVDQV